MSASVDPGCWRRYVHKPEDPEKRKVRLRAFRQRNPEKNRAKNRLYKGTNPEKARAHKVVEVALKRGDLTRRPCERCGRTDLVHAHHDDYSQPLHVMWLCPTHHRERHRELEGRPS